MFHVKHASAFRPSFPNRNSTTLTMAGLRPSSERASASGLTLSAALRLQEFIAAQTRGAGWPARRPAMVKGVCAHQVDPKMATNALKRPLHAHA
jgi:hypothetical protein